jgi:hypothetical protein
MNNCTHWSAVFTMALRFKLRVLMVNAFVRFVDAQEARAVVEGINGETGFGESNVRGGVMARWMGIFHGNSKDHSKSSSKQEDVAFVEYWSTLTLTIIRENSGNLDQDSKFVQVRNAPGAVALQVFRMGSVVGCSPIIAQRATSCQTGDRWNK